MTSPAKYAPKIAAYEVTWTETTAREQANAQRAFVRNARKLAVKPSIWSRFVAWLGA